MKLSHRLKIIAFSLVLSLFLVGNSLAGIDFEGIDDFASSSATWNLSAYKTITVSFWLRWDAFANNDDFALESSVTINSNDGAIVIDPNSGAPTSGYAQLAFQDSGVGGPWYRAEGFTRPSQGVWHHWSCVFINEDDANEDVKLFIDGTEQATQVLGGNTINQHSGFGNYTWYFMSRAGTSLFGDGEIKEFYVHTRELTGAEILTMTNSKIRGIGTHFPNCFVYLPFDDQETGTSANGDTVHDYQNGLNLTANDGANNTGCSWTAETILTYPPKIGNWN